MLQPEAAKMEVLKIQFVLNWQNRLSVFLLTLRLAGEQMVGVYYNTLEKVPRLRVILKYLEDITTDQKNP